MSSPTNNANYPQINQEVVRQLVADVGPESCARLVNVFINETRERAERIRALAAGDDLDTLEREAHSLKSTALTYGLEGLGTTARNMELACREGARERVRELAGVIVETSGPALNALQSLLDNPR